MSLHNTRKNKKSQSKQGQNDGVFPFWKNPGETLAVMLRRFRDEHGIPPDEKITYAGRLDPMAEGVVPLLVGAARFQKEKLLAASKTYEVEILLGIGTDTGDMLGLPTAGPTLSTAKDAADLAAAVATLSQTVALPYPSYSSRPVEGKPLFVHARAGNTVALPIKKVTIYGMELVSVRQESLQTLIQKAVAIIATVQGDFRQKEIIEKWASLANASAVEKVMVQIVTIRTTVSSGTYMRVLAEKLGLLLKIPALAYKIVRTEVKNK